MGENDDEGKIVIARVRESESEVVQGGACRTSVTSGIIVTLSL